MTAMLQAILGQSPLPTSDRRAGRKKKRRRNKKQADFESEEDKPMEVEDEHLDIEYVPEKLDLPEDSPLEEFQTVFEKFIANAVRKVDLEDDVEIVPKEVQDKERDNKGEESEHEDEENENENPSKISRKKLRKMNRLSVAELKQLVEKPEVVEWVDVTSADPKLLVAMKSYRNTVPIPRHWCQKRKYLQGKRGIEKPPFELPDFIKDTGIMEMRQAFKEKEEQSKLKTKTRDRLQPKMGKLDIDYQKLHDAFFRFQTKPKLTIHGEMYYEGKEFETKLKEKKPGHLSDELKSALSIPPLAPPPWLINMQRYGPPPSYPSLKIPGLNAPIPDGAQWGYHPGGWGKPPVDEYNRPLYGDVFGTVVAAVPAEMVEPVEKTLWGELEEEEWEEPEIEQEAETEEQPEAEENAEAAETSQTEHIKEGLATPSGLASVPSGLETPDVIELRKRTSALNEPEENPQLYKVLPQKEVSVSGFMGSQHVYDVSALTSDKPTGSKRKLGAGVEVTLDPAELEHLDEASLKKKFDNATVAGTQREDFSDMVAEHMNKQTSKKKQKKEEGSSASSSGSSSKKYKEFKF